MAPKKPKPTGKAISASTARTKKEDDARLAGFAKSRNEQARGYSQMGKAVLGGAVLGKGYSAAMNSYKFGKTVIHGSPTKNLKSINPTKGSQDAPKENVVWAFNPKAKGSVLHPESAKGYSGDKGSIYVGKVPRSSVKKIDPATKSVGRAGRNEPIVVSGKPIKVSKEIKLEGKSTQKVVKEVNKALKKSGSKGLKGNKYPKPLPSGRKTDF